MNVGVIACMNYLGSIMFLSIMPYLQITKNDRDSTIGFFQAYIFCLPRLYLVSQQVLAI